MLLSIETSCDETSVAIFNLRNLGEKVIDGSDILSEKIYSQILSHQPYGGVVPEISAREHIKTIPLLIQNVFEEIEIQSNDISHVSVTSGPGLKGSLLTGYLFAKSFAYAKNIPLIPVNHLEGHLLSTELLEIDQRPKYPALALLVSGGHTQLYLIKKIGDYELLAQTRDDAAGEAFDKCATMLSLPYPGGPYLSKIAKDGDALRYAFSKGLPTDYTSFSFSGLKTAFSKLSQKELALATKQDHDQCKSDLAACLEKTIVDDLTSKLSFYIKKLNPSSLILTGGVAANLPLRNKIRELGDSNSIFVSIPPLKWCTDNAAMIGVAAIRKLELTDLGEKIDFDMNLLERTVNPERIVESWH